MTAGIRRTSLAVILFTEAALPISVDEVIAGHLDALGRFKSIKTIRLTGTVTPYPGAAVKLVVEKKRPNKLRVEFTPPGAPTGVEGYDGRIACESNPFDDAPDPTQVSGYAATALERAADFDGRLVNYHEKGHEVELVGNQHSGDGELYNLKVTRKDGSVSHYHLDAKTLLTRKTFEIRSVHAGKPRPTTTVFRDYRKVDGVYFAFELDETAPGGHHETVRWERIETNVDLLDSRFAMPKAKK